MQNSSPIRSIHAIGSRHLDGAEVFFARLVRGLNDRGYPSMGVVRSGSPLQYERSGIATDSADMRNGLDVFTVWKIRRLIRRYSPRRGPDLPGADQPD